MLPEGWRELSFKDVADVVYSNVDKKSYPGQKEVVLCNYMDVFRNNYITKNMDFMPSTASDREIEKFTLNKGDVIFTKDSETIEEIAKSAVVIDDLENVVCGYHLGIARPKENVANGVFLANLFSLHPFRKKIMSLANGVTRFGLNLGAFDQIDLSMPPLIEQDKIADIVISLDAAIEATRAVIGQTGRVKNALMTDLLTRGLPGRHKNFKPSPLGEIPEGWEVVEIGDVAEHVTSGSRGWAQYYADHGAVFVRITNLKRNSLRLDMKDTQYVSLPQSESEGTRTRLQVGDILVSITADLGIVGYIYEVPGGEAYINQHVALVRLQKTKDINPEFIALYLSSPVGQPQFFRMGDAGAKAGLNLNNIRRTKICIPPRDEQDKILLAINSAEESTRISNQRLQQLLILKSALMQVLLTGKIRVPVAESFSQPARKREVANG